MKELARYVELKGDSTDFRWQGKWMWFKDELHIKNWEKFMARKGYETELHIEKPR